MTQTDLMKNFRALGCEVAPKSWDDVRGEEVVTTYGVTVSMSSMGSMAVRVVRETDEVDPAALVAEMAKDLKARAKATRAAIRRERSQT
ncbi:MAG TPA: hypothetical protein VLN57_21150 [Xanthobacteraceae bacterium]|nr:hypothetical protein [Xanthobacteraceae bacterium]